MADPLQDSEGKWRRQADDARRVANRERSQLFAKVEAAKKEWETTFDAMSDGIAIMSPDFEILRANRSLASMLNTTPQALIGRRICEAICGLELPFEDCPAVRCMAQKVTCEIERREPRLGNRWLHIRVNPLLDASGEVRRLIHTTRDITKRKLMEGAL